MQTFIAQTALYGTTVIRSKHEHNFAGNWGEVSLVELNEIRSLVFRFALANYVCLTSLRDLIARLENGWPPVTKPDLINAFAITEIREAYENKDLRNLYHIQEYLHEVIEAGIAQGYSYQDQLSNETAQFTRIGDFALAPEFNWGVPVFVELGDSDREDDSDSDFGSDSDEEWEP